MTDRARVAYFLATLVAVFVLAWFTGAVLGPRLGIGTDDPSPADEHGMSLGAPDAAAATGSRP